MLLFDNVLLLIDNFLVLFQISTNYLYNFTNYSITDYFCLKKSSELHIKIFRSAIILFVTHWYQKKIWKFFNTHYCNFSTHYFWNYSLIFQYQIKLQTYFVFLVYTLYLVRCLLRTIKIVCKKLKSNVLQAILFFMW